MLSHESSFNSSGQLKSSSKSLGYPEIPIITDSRAKELAELYRLERLQSAMQHEGPANWQMKQQGQDIDQLNLQVVGRDGRFVYQV